MPNAHEAAPERASAGAVGIAFTKAVDATEPSKVPSSAKAMFCVAFAVPRRSEIIEGIDVTPPPYANDKMQ